MKSIIIAIVSLIVGAGAAIWIVTILKSTSTSEVGTGAAGHSASDLQIVCSARVSASGPEVAIYPKVAGQVKFVRAKEGDRVYLGSSVLFELDETMYRIKADGAQGAMNGARASPMRRFKVATTPAFAWWKARMRASLAANASMMAALPSLEPSSMIRNSKF